MIATVDCDHIVGTARSDVQQVKLKHEHCAVICNGDSRQGVV